MMRAKLDWVSWASICALGALLGCAADSGDGPDGVGGTVNPPTGGTAPGNPGGAPAAGGGQGGGGQGGSTAPPATGGGDGMIPPAAGGGGGTGTTVSYAETVEPLILTSCVPACHIDGGNGGPNGFSDMSTLDLTEGMGYQSLTTGMSMQTGQPFIGATLEESYVWLKLNPNPPVGLPMPFGTILPEADRETIRTWIEAGAAP